MAYATVDDVQALLPVRTWDSADEEAEPSTDTVEAWLDQDAAWIDLHLSECPAFDPSEEPAAGVLLDVNASLTAARVRDFKFPDEDGQARYADLVRAEAKERLTLLAQACGGQDPEDDDEEVEGKGRYRSLQTEPYFQMEVDQW